MTKVQKIDVLNNVVASSPSINENISVAIYMAARRITPARAKIRFNFIGIPLV